MESDGIIPFCLSQKYDDALSALQVSDTSVLLFIKSTSISSGCWVITDVISTQYSLYQTSQILHIRYTNVAIGQYTYGKLLGT